jgi:hypothetical protein
MNKGLIQKLLPHFIAVGVFLIVAAIYCKPVLQGQVLQQEDIVQWKAMSKQLFDYKETHGNFPLWTKSMFSGMPAYQIAMESHNKVSPGIFYTIFTLGLPKPISFFFLACICFYFLSQVLRINPYIGLVCALAFAYSTYNPVLVATGHDTKMQSIALLPAFIGSLMLLYDGRYLWGAALTALFTSLLIGMNHMQIVYYAIIIAFFMTVGYLVHWIRRKEFKHLSIALAIAVVCGLLGVFTNAITIFTTNEAAKTTIRGGSELADSSSRFTKTGLNKEYAFDYSMYKSEPFVMMFPKMYGGSDRLEVPEEESKAVEQYRTFMQTIQQMPPEQGQQLQQFADDMQYNLGSYWGGIGGTSGPPYVGAIICFLALIGFFILDSKHKWWILATTVLAILMSWGGYFDSFNSMLLKVLPMYDKFRAPSVTIVVPTFLFCMMSAMALQKIVFEQNRQELWDRYKKGLIFTGAVFVVILLIYWNADFTSQKDQAFPKRWAGAPPQIMEYWRNVLNGIKADRKELFFGSITRSFLFVAAAAAIAWLRIKKNLPVWATIGAIGLLSFIDLMAVDVKYLSTDNYKDVEEYQANFQPSAADSQIMQDTSNYRVFDSRYALDYGAKTAYFHNSVGGYHPAKLSIYQDLIEHQLSKANIQQLYFSPGSMPVLNMLNTKYIIVGSQQRDTALTNPANLGAAWFVNYVRFETTPLAVMNALTAFNPKDTAIVFEKDKSLVSYSPTADSADQIQLIKNDNDEVLYKAKASTNRFAVFSEVFYDKGWKAFIDGKESPIVRTNYVLRGLSIPAGEHEIKFVFHPASYYTGEKIALFCGLLVLLLVVAAIVQAIRNRKTATTTVTTTTTTSTKRKA